MANMKTAKLVTGVLCMVFTALVVFQSCAVGVVNIVESTGESSGMAGLFVALLMLSGGIIQVATRKSEKKGGSIGAFIVFALAAVMGFSMAGTYTDLNVWAGWCLILGILNLICIVTGKKKE
jgi:hypothetical protein